MNTRWLCALALIPLHLVGCGDDTSTGGGGGAGTGAAQPGGSSGEGGATGGGAPVNACPNPDSVQVITQATAGDTIYSIGAVGFEYEPAMGLDGSEVVVVSMSANHVGQIALGTTDLQGLDGSVISFAIVDAVTDLINATPADMDGRLFAATGGTVTIEEAPDYGTQFKGRLRGTLSNVTYVELAANLEPLENGDCLFLETGAFDAAGWVEDCDAPPESPSGGACLDWMNIGHNCNPITNEGCTDEEICDWGGYFQCYPIEGTEVGLCEACMSLEGPHCQQGMTCDGDTDPGRCFKYCCNDADCGTGATCIAYSYAPTGIGVCLTE